MGRKNPDRLTAEEWRMGHEHLDSLVRDRWRITAICNGCHLQVHVDLRVMIFLLGAKGTLWNRHPQCRRVGCESRVTFWAQPPQALAPFPMRAEWPPGVPPLAGRH